MSHFGIRVECRIGVYVGRVGDSPRARTPVVRMRRPQPGTSSSAAETVQIMEAALRSLNRALNRHYTMDDRSQYSLATRGSRPLPTFTHEWWEARIARQQ